MSSDSGKILNTERRLKIDEWIYNQLEENNIPGLQWTNKEKLTFKINWIHGSNLIPIDCSDVVLAMDWASYKGKNQGRSFHKLKARLRCALNSSKKLKFISKEKTFRTYQFVQENNNLKDHLDEIDELIDYFFQRSDFENRYYPLLENDRIIKEDDLVKTNNYVENFD